MRRPRSPLRTLLPVVVLPAVAMLGGCAGESPAPMAVTPAQPALVAASFAVADALPPARLGAAATALQAALRASGLAAERRADGALRLRFDAEAGFEIGSAQMVPGLLTPVVAAAEAIAAAEGGWVVHLRGTAVRAEDAGLAARRAQAMRAVAAGRGLPGGRLRADTRVQAGAAGVEWIVVPVVAGAEAAAWQPPA